MFTVDMMRIEVRDLLAVAIDEVTYDVSTEPALARCLGKRFHRAPTRPTTLE